MNLKTVLTPKQSLNKAYLKEKVTRTNIELFKNNLIQFIDGIDEKESEEYVKNLVTKFLYDTYCNGKNQINTKGRIDLAIYEDKKPVVIIEAKRPSSPDMVTVENLNTRATHELMLYYLQERVEHGNIDVKYLIITNMYEWFVFDSSVFDTLFCKNSALMKDFNDWKNGRKTRTDRDHFYNDIAKTFLKNLNEEIRFTWFDLRQVAEFAKNDNQKDDAKLIDLYKILSPAHLLKQPFANDSNSLDTKFYSELLHLIGLEEKKEGGKKIIQRKEKPDAGSLIENTINILESEDRLHKLPGNADFGDTKEERLFNVALELCITWINRILFLKLLEGQLLNYHKGNKDYRFLDFKNIPNYDELNKLFFQVLARKFSERTSGIKDKFSHVPYLNSSLFDISSLEDDTIRINSLDESARLKLHSATVLKNEHGKRREGDLPILQYLFEFLDAYDFSSEGKEEIQEENKTLINASVLGLIFEKINGYKDGSFFTPGFITMYMCRETIRGATVQKFNEAKDWKIETFDQLYNKIVDIKEANDVINSLKICDPAVGSGHFLVSALNEIIAIKSELGILCDRKGNRLREYSVEVVNDELMISINAEDFFEYAPGNQESQRVQEALFHEKQTLIENCLFGVDINPNSVKICRLRLWIELLKNAYYTTESKYKELETLPNIDINIKQGNSLISRFTLDADLSKALKSIKYSIDDYRGFVDDYKNATDKEAKRGFEKLIGQIKKDFRTEIGKNDPKIQVLNKKSGELYNLLNQARVFEPTEKQKREQTKKKEKLESEIKKLAVEIEEIKSSTIYKDAFEWRFEFPEVLDKDGSFLGFDLVIGNPPYGDLFTVQIKNYILARYENSFSGTFDIYVTFFELALKLAKEHGVVSYITPHTFIEYPQFSKARLLLMKNTSVTQLLKLTGVFDDAVVDNVISIIDCNVEQNDVIKTAIFKSKVEKIESNLLISAAKDILSSDGFFLSTDKSRIDPSKIALASKQLGSCVKITQGITTGGNDCFIGDESTFSSIGVTSDTIRKTLRGENISKYELNFGGEYILYSIKSMSEVDHEVIESFLLPHKSRLSKKRETVQGKLPWYCLHWPRNQEDLDRPKILIRQTASTIIATLDTEGYYPIDSTHTMNLLEGITDELNELKYLLGLLNSRLFEYLYRNRLDEVGKVFPQIKKANIDWLPIKLATPDKKKNIVTLVDSIIQFKQKGDLTSVKTSEQKINQMIYQLYGLTEDEIKIVEEN